MFQYRFACVILCNVGKVYILEIKCCISAALALGHVRVLILSSYILLACLNKTDISFHAW